jgi:hypothetical protein
MPNTSRRRFRGRILCTRSWALHDRARRKSGGYLARCKALYRLKKLRGGADNLTFEDMLYLALRFCGDTLPELPPLTEEEKSRMKCFQPGFIQRLIADVEAERLTEAEA